MKKKYKIVIKIDFVIIKVSLFDNGIQKKKKNQFALLQTATKQGKKRSKILFMVVLWPLIVDNTSDITNYG